MGYQSKTYSLSDEVVEAIEAKKAAGVSPDRYLWSLMFKQKKPSKRAQMAEALASSDLTAKVVGRDDIEYGSHTDLPQGQHVATLDAVGPPVSGGKGKATSESWRRAPRQKGDKSR